MGTQTPVLTPGNLAGLTLSKASEITQPTLNILIYGESGIGKTVLAGSCDLVPEMRPILFVDIEGGTFSLQNFGYNVDIVRVTSWKDMQTLYDELYAGKTKYRTIILDSLTEIQKFNMYDIMKDQVLKKPDMDPDIPSMREWGKNIEQIRRFVRAFRDLPMNTIFTALQRIDKDDRTGVRWTLPDMSGKLASQVSAFMDIVGYYYQKQLPDEKGELVNQRLLLTQKTETQIAKDRSGRLPIVIEDPTMRTIFDLMYPPKTQKASAAS